MRECVLYTFVIVTATLFFTTDAIACKRSPDAGFKASGDLSYTLVRTLAHATEHFTQGLVIDAGRVFESSGRYGRSALIATQIDGTRALRRRALPDAVFAEGLALHDDRFYQLSWREGLLFIWNRDFELLRVQSYTGEGWGLTSNGTELIMSDGSDRLFFRDPQTFAVTRTLQVCDGETPITRLNELEYVNELVFANVWFSNRIAVIAADSGAVCAWLDLSALHALLPDDGALPHEAVLNGIAYDASSGHFYVTGKLWPRLFELELGPLPAACPAGPRP